jgi:hypothetical protein
MVNYWVNLRQWVTNNSRETIEPGETISIKHDTFILIALLSISYGVAAAMIFATIRSSVAGHSEYVWIILIQTFAVIGIAVIANHIELKSKKDDGLLLPASFILLSLWVVFSWRLGLASLFFQFGAIAIAVIILVRHLRFVAPIKIFVVVFVGLILGILYFILLNGGRNASVFADLRARLGWLHADELSLSAIVNMISISGIPSNGADGIVPRIYHAGAHYWVAGIKNLSSDIETPVLMAASMQIFTIPILFFFSMLAIVKLSAPLRVAPIAILSFLLLFVWLTEIEIWDYYLLSESYGFSLIFAALSLPMGFRWLDLPSAGRDISSGKFISAVVITFFAFLTKVSTGFCIGVFLSLCFFVPYVSIQPRRAAILGLLLILLASIASYITIFNWTDGNLSRLSLRLFDFDYHYPSIFRAHIISAVIGLGIIWFYRVNLGVNSKNKLIILAATMLAGLLPGIAGFTPHSLDNYWFCHTPLFMICIVTAACIFQLFSELSSTKHRFALSVVILCLFVLLVATKNKRYKPYAVIDELAALQIGTPSALAEHNEHLMALGFVLGVKDRFSTVQRTFHDIKSGKELVPPVARQSIEATTVSRVVSAIKSEMKKNEGSNVIVYVSPTAKEFWLAGKACWIQTLVVPALIGRPMLMGIPQDDDPDCIKNTFGLFDRYSALSHNRIVSDTQLCTYAVQRGYDVIIGVDTLLIPRTIKCK